MNYFYLLCHIKKLMVILFLCLVLTSHASFAKIQVNVGGYYYPPFVDITSKKVSGLSLSMIEILNKQQDKYHFNFILTTAEHRYQDFKDNKYDIVLFENIAWGWQAYPVSPSDVYLTDKEVYIALKKSDRDQSFFQRLNNKVIAGIEGYHYRLFDYKIKKSEIEQNFTVTLAKKHNQNINAILNNTADIAIVNWSYLQGYLLKYPEIKHKILIADKLDQRYTHSTLIRKNSVIDVKTFNHLLKLMKQNGALDQLWQQYGLEIINQ